MDYKEKYEQALERAKEIKSKILSSHLSTESCKAVSEYIDTIIPELAESEDERVRKLLIWQVYRNIEDETNDLSQSVYDGIKGHDPDLEESIEDWKKCLAYLEKQKGQKPISKEDMPYITDEHFWEREPADSFKYKLAEYMTKCCTKKEGPYGYEYGISAETILKMAEEELLKRGVVQKPAEGKYYSSPDCGTTAGVWSEEDKSTIADLINYFEGDALECSTEEMVLRIKSLRPQPQGTYKQVIHTIFGMLKDKDFYEIQPSHRVSLLNDIRVKCKDAIECAPILDEPQWKPSEEQMDSLNYGIYVLEEEGYDEAAREIKEIYEQLKKLMED